MQAVTITQISVTEFEILIENTIKKILLPEKGNQNESDCWFDLSELCQYHPDKPSKATVYGWVHTGLIPHNKSGKKLRFLKAEIDSWLKQGRKRTIFEASTEAEIYLNKKGRK